MSVLGVGPLAANAPLQIGANIVLPTPGPWTIHNIWVNVVHDVPTAAEGITGSLIFNSFSGDIVPDPAPGTYPMVGASATIGANIEMTESPVQMFDTNWTAPGKATVQFFLDNDILLTVGGFASAGVIFGDTVPEKRPLTFCDHADVLFAGGAEAAIGNIVLSEKANRIVGICGILTKTGVVVVNEGIMGTFRLASNDLPIQPATYPFNNGFNGALGVPLGQSTPVLPNFIPVDIPVPGGATIQTLVTTQAAVTNNVHARVYIAYE